MDSHRHPIAPSLDNRNPSRVRCPIQPRTARSFAAFGAALAATVTLFVLTGCSGKQSQVSEGQPFKAQTITKLGPGDVVKIMFRKSPDLNQTQRVRSNGKISLFQVGNVHVAGKTIEQLQTDLTTRYELKEKGELVVSLEVPGTFVYVTGAVQKPGKLPLDRPLTLFEAIVESGNFDSETANRKKVKLTRLEGGRFVTRVFDLKSNPTTAEFLKPYDIIEVPRFF